MDPSWMKSAIETSAPKMLVQTTAVETQYLSGLLIGLGTGGVAGASTLGVALFSLYAPEGHLKEFQAMVPVVNCVSNIATVSVYLKNANWSLCMRMWPWILFGICVGTAMLPYIPEPALRTLTSVIYACVLFQRVYEKQQQ